MSEIENNQGFTKNERTVLGMLFRDKNVKYICEKLDWNKNKTYKIIHNARTKLRNIIQE